MQISVPLWKTTELNKQHRSSSPFGRLLVLCEDEGRYGTAQIQGGSWELLFGGCLRQERQTIVQKHHVNFIPPLSV